MVSARQCREYSRLALIIFLACDLGCRTSAGKPRAETGVPPLGKEARGTDVGAGRLTPKEAQTQIGTIAQKVKSAYSDFLQSDDHSSPNLTAIARAITTMDPDLLREILASRDDFTNLQRDISTVSRAQGARGSDSPKETYIEGEVPWDNYQQIEGSIEDPFAKVYTAGKVLLAIGVGGIVLGYFVQVTNKQHSNFAAIEKLRAVQDKFTTLFTDKNARLETTDLPAVRTTPGDSTVSTVRAPAAPEEAKTDVLSTRSSQLPPSASGDESLRDGPEDLKTGLDSRQAEAKASGFATEQRYEASKMLKYGGVAAAVAGVVVLVGADYTNADIKLVDVGKGEKKPPVSPGVAQLMTALAQLELSLQRIYAAMPAR